MSPAKRKPMEPYDPKAEGCACRVCHEKVTPPTAADLQAVPDELAEAFEEASFEASHAHNYSSPIASEDAYIRGGIIAVLKLLPSLGWTPPKPLPTFGHTSSEEPADADA